MALPVALQLYTVRDVLDENVEEGLRKVKAAGYDYVEPAGMCGKTPKEFKALLDKTGLKAVSAHVSYDDFLTGGEKIIDDYIAIGADKYLVLPYMPEGKRPGDPNYSEVLENIKIFAARCKAKGIQLLYHNHDFEFDKLPDGQYGLDYLYASVPDLATEFDTCWVKVAGEDPVAYLNKYAGRSPVVHIKDFVGQKTENMYELIGTDTAKAVHTQAFEFRPVGSGVQDFPSILEAAEKCGAKYVVVEQDQHYGADPIEDIKSSRDYLKKLGW